MQELSLQQCEQVSGSAIRIFMNGDWLWVYDDGVPPYDGTVTVD